MTNCFLSRFRIVRRSAKSPVPVLIMLVNVALNFKKRDSLRPDGNFYGKDRRGNFCP
jgi:hypothetical protein